MEQLEQLWALQDLDLAIAALQEKIEHNPLREELRVAREKLGELQASLERGAELKAEQQKQLKSMELDFNKVVADRTALHKKLYGGEVSNLRELKSMEQRLASLETEQESLEEAIFKLMEKAEADQQKLGELKEETGRQEETVQTEDGRLQQELVILNLQLEELRERHAKILPLIESKYLDLYHTQCRRFQGKGISRVINGTCEGCRMYISSAQRGLLYNPSSIVYCENCGRLLVKLPDQVNDNGDTRGESTNGSSKKKETKK